MFSRHVSGTKGRNNSPSGRIEPVGVCALEPCFDGFVFAALLSPFAALSAPQDGLPKKL